MIAAGDFFDDTDSVMSGQRAAGPPLPYSYRLVLPQTVQISLCKSLRSILLHLPESPCSSPAFPPRLSRKALASPAPPQARKLPDILRALSL